jgi:hypothetical protein
MLYINISHLVEVWVFKAFLHIRPKIRVENEYLLQEIKSFIFSCWVTLLKISSRSYREGF